MATRLKETLRTDGEAEDRDAAQQHAKAGHDDACRCKETSRMTPAELMKLMIRDLAFWKKEK